MYGLAMVRDAVVLFFMSQKQTIQQQHDTLVILEKYLSYCLLSSQRAIYRPKIRRFADRSRRKRRPRNFAMMFARTITTCTLLLAWAAHGSSALQLGAWGRRAVLNSAWMATCGAVLPAVAAGDLPAADFKAYSGKVPFSLEQAAQMDAEATSRRAFSDVTEENRRARISFGSTGKLLFEVPYELDGTVEFMWVKDSKDNVVAAKKIRNGESFPATLAASVPSGMVTVVAKCTDTLWEGSVNH